MCTGGSSDSSPGPTTVRRASRCRDLCLRATVRVAPHANHNDSPPMISMGCCSAGPFWLFAPLSPEHDGSLSVEEAMLQWRRTPPQSVHWVNDTFSYFQVTNAC